ncbi:hypothetical protein CHLNCDRAFT_17265, partial [Chlorella variabilis]
VYVSEARDGDILRQLESVARQAPGACLANLFTDEPYNRTNFTLVGRSVPALAAAASTLARAALALLDLRQHAATHPRLGCVDHISCHPLPTSEAGSAAAAAAAADAGELRQRQQDEAGAAALAVAIASELGSGPQAVPVYTYGWAHQQRQPLDAVRRQLGYFQGSSWHGGLQAPAAEAAGAADAELQLPLAPCFGPAVVPARSGVCCVGAGRWIVNYNVLLLTEDMVAARAVARSVSERGGGLAAVQAMALRHLGGIEVACNLLQPATTPPEAVLGTIQRLAGQRGLAVGPAYRTNKAPEELV